MATVDGAVDGRSLPPSPSIDSPADTPTSFGDWDTMAKTFDRFVSLTQFYSGAALDYLTDHIQNAATRNYTPLIVDVAAGTGSCAIEAALRFPNCRIMATDISKVMLDVMKMKVQKDAMSNVDIKMMDGQALEMDDESVDALTCVFGIMFYGDRSRGWKEMHRVLKSGSRAAVVTWRTIGLKVIMDEVVLRTRKVEEKGGDGAAEVGEKPKEGQATLLSKAACLSSSEAVADDLSIADCEFSCVETHLVTHMWEVVGEQEIESTAKMMVQTPVFQEGFKSIDDVELATLKLVEVMRDRLNENGKVAVFTDAIVTVLTK